MPDVDIIYGIAQPMNNGQVKIPYAFYIVDYPSAGKRYKIKSDVYTYTPDPDTKTKAEMLTEIRNAVKAQAQTDWENWKKVFDLELEEFVGFKETVTVT